jgi:hypothetical protein
MPLLSPDQQLGHGVLSLTSTTRLLLHFEHMTVFMPIALSQGFWMRAVGFRALISEVGNAAVQPSSLSD